MNIKAIAGTVFLGLFLAVGSQADELEMSPSWDGLVEIETSNVILPNLFRGINASVCRQNPLALIFVISVHFSLSPMVQFGK